MRWLVDCEALSIPIEGELPPVKNPASIGEICPVQDNGEPLAPVLGRLRTLPVYSWLGFEHRPEILLLRVGVLARLERALTHLPSDFDLVVIDGYRTRAFQAELLAYYAERETTSLAGFVSDPEDWQLIPPHTTGGAVDITLGWRGAALGLGTDFDSFTPDAAPAAFEGGSPNETRDLRRLLANVLSAEGFTAIDTEWWHWSFGDQRWASDTGATTAIYGEIF